RSWAAAPPSAAAPPPPGAAPRPGSAPVPADRPRPRPPAGGETPPRTPPRRPPHRPAAGAPGPRSGQDRAAESRSSGANATAPPRRPAPEAPATPPGGAADVTPGPGSSPPTAARLLDEPLPRVIEPPVLEALVHRGAVVEVAELGVRVGVDDVHAL